MASQEVLDLNQSRDTSSSVAVSKPSSSKWLILSIIEAIIIAALIAALIAIAVRQPETKTVNTTTNQDVGELSYSYCQPWSDCANSPQEFALILNATQNGFAGPACTDNNLLGRMIPYQSTNTSWEPVTITRKGRVGFAIGPEMLAKILAFGQNGATSIMRELGYGSSYYCGTPANNYTDCQFRLLMWQVPCPKTRPPLTQAFWENLQPFMNSIYGNATPNFTNAIATIRSAKGLLDRYTGCNPVTLNALSSWQLSAQIAANCSTDFINAMANFSDNTCNGTDKSKPVWTGLNGCLAEDKFLAIPEPTAVQLRAYLMQNEGFNPLYTGYGFTSNAGYYDPLQEEFWYVNDYVTNLDNSTVITILNGTAWGLSYYT